MMHPGIKVQFELDMKHGDAALRCMQCNRPRSPNTKHPERLPRKIHPPLACGMTIFGESNSFWEVSALAAAHNASLLLLLRRNHVARAISAHLHFTRLVHSGPHNYKRTFRWNAQELRRQAEKMARGSASPYPTPPPHSPLPALPPP